MSKNQDAWWPQATNLEKKIKSLSDEEIPESGIYYAQLHHRIMEQIRHMESSKGSLTAFSGTRDLDVSEVDKVKPWTIK